MTGSASLNFEDDFVQIIDGKSATTKKTRHGVNPANLQAMAEVPVATQENLDDAVTAAKRAFKTWSKVPYEQRFSAVLAYADALNELKTQFRDLLVSEQGKPVRPALVLCEHVGASQLISFIFRWPRRMLRPMRPLSGCKK